MIECVSVVGAGSMGRGIAWALAQAGIQAVIKEASDETSERSRGLLTAELHREIDRWSLTKSEMAAVLSRISFTAELDALAGGALLIEAIEDDLERKQALFADLGARMPERQIFVTNTSSLSVSELAESSRRPDRFLGMHFALPVPKRPLVELVRGLKTSDGSLALARELARTMGKTAVETLEGPGCLTTRIIIPYLNEAMNLVMEGMATAEDVDTAMKLAYDFPVGPLALADRMGLDEVMRWMEHLFHELGETKYRPCALLRRMVRAGHLGVKSGQGFFRYEPE